MPTFFDKIQVQIRKQNKLEFKRVWKWVNSGMKCQIYYVRVETTLHFILFSREIRKNLLFPTKSSKICWPVLAILHLL